jgi:(2Fe-2S) ferredoxin
MSKEQFKKQFEFKLEGRFLNFAAQDSYQLKYLRLLTAGGEYFIKLPKDLRSSMYRTLTPGEWVQVTGYQELNYKKGTVKFKADQITVTTPASAPANQSLQTSEVPEPAPQKAALPKSNACILVCQKSDCCKRGGRVVVEALQKELDDRGLTEQVTIKGTGCMKRCKAGPNLVMPDKTRYTRVHPESVSELVEQHFPKADKTAVHSEQTVTAGN